MLQRTSMVERSDASSSLSRIAVLAILLVGFFLLTQVFFTPRAFAQASEARVFDFTIKGRKVQPPSNVVRVQHGDIVELRILSDEQAELHLHGYDLKLVLEPKVVGIMRFNARIAGRFPLESHGFGAPSGSRRHGGGGPLLYVEVHPR